MIISQTVGNVVLFAMFFFLVVFLHKMQAGKKASKFFLTQNYEQAIVFCWNLSQQLYICQACMSSPIFIFFWKIGIYSMQGMELQEKEEGKYKSKRE